MVNKLIKEYQDEIKRLEESKKGYEGLILDQLDKWDSNRVCYMNGKLSTLKQAVYDLKRIVGRVD